MAPPTGRHHDAPTPGRATRVATTAPTTPRASRSASGDYGSDQCTAQLEASDTGIVGLLSVLVPAATGPGMLRRYQLTAELGWDNTGSTGYRGTATREGGAGSTRVTLVLSGRGHLHVELFHLQDEATADAAAPVSDRHSFEADRGVRTVLTATGPASLTAGVAVGEPYPDIDVLLEQIAHRFAYLDVLDPTTIETLDHWGWRVVPHARLEGDLQYLALRPIPGRPEPRDPVIAFRGTEPTSGADWADDFDTEGVGRYEFARNEAAIRATLHQLGGGVTVTGHSLGGALAQICAGTYPGEVARVVTFQSPGVSADLAGAAGRAHIESRHHVVDGCVVGLAGGAHTPGTTIHHHADGAIDPASAHMVLPLAEETEAGLPDGAGFDDRPRHTMVETTTTTEDPSWGAAEAFRAWASWKLDDSERDEYVRAWTELRSRASEGTTPYRALTRMIEAAPASAREGLRANLDQMFPELAAADELEARVYDGTIDGEQPFVDAVEAAIGSLDSAQRERLRRYFTAISAHVEHRSRMAG